MTRDEAVKMLQATRLMLMDGANQPISDLYYALDMAIEALQDEIWKDEPCDKCVFVKGSGWCDNCNGKPKGLDALPNSRKAEQTEPQTHDKHTETHSCVKDEPQKDCKKCKNYDRCKNNRWKCCVYQPKDEP